jgi:integrase
MSPEWVTPMSEMGDVGSHHPYACFTRSMTPGANRHRTRLNPLTEGNIMGTVFRKVVTRPVPAGATITQCRDGTATAKWTPRGARRPVVAPVVTLDDGRQVVRQESGSYFARYRDAGGLVREVTTRCRDKAAAEQRLAELERRADRIRAGVMTRREADAADRMNESLDQHIDDYIDRLPGKRGGQATPLHRDNTRRYLRRLAADCGWSCPADLSRSDLEAWIADQSRKGRSARSINCHRAAAAAFASWLADPLIGRLPSNPFGTGRAGVPKADEESDPRRRRRALWPDELTRLVEAAYNAPEPPTTRRYGEHGETVNRYACRLTGRDRGDLWLFLAGTGLRRDEVRKLIVADVRLDAVPPHVRVTAAAAKSRKEQSVPLRSDLVEMLRTRLAGRRPTDNVFEVPGGLIRRFNADCRRAGIPKRDAEGRTVDVHSLRTTFATMLSRSGVTPRVAMELLRHSRIDLTMRTYTDPRLLPLAAAVESLPSVAPSVALSVAAPGDFARLSVASPGTDVQGAGISSDVA